MDHGWVGANGASGNTSDSDSRCVEHKLFVRTSARTSHACLYDSPSALLRLSCMQGFLVEQNLAHTQTWMYNLHCRMPSDPFNAVCSIVCVCGRCQDIAQMIVLIPLLCLSRESNFEPFEARAWLTRPTRRAHELLLGGSARGPCREIPWNTHARSQHLFVNSTLRAWHSKNIGPSQTKFSQARANIAKVWSTLANIGQHCAMRGQSAANYCLQLLAFGPSWAESRPNLGRDSAQVCVCVCVC